jgi:hypothetical protein
VSKNYVIKDTATQSFEPFSRISNRLYKEIDCCQWRARHYSANPSEKNDTYQDVREGGRIFTSKYIRGLLCKVRHVRRVRWVTGEPGLLFDGGLHGYWLLIEAGSHPKLKNLTADQRHWVAQKNWNKNREKRQ